MGIGDNFTRRKARPGLDADHSPQSSTEVVNEKELDLLCPLLLHDLQWNGFAFTCGF
jgi:hypothetical protein